MALTSASRDRCMAHALGWTQAGSCIWVGDHPRADENPIPPPDQGRGEPALRSAGDEWVRWGLSSVFRADYRGERRLRRIVQQPASCLCEPSLSALRISIGGGCGIMTLDTVTLSRLQFAFTIGYHIIWPAYSIGIAGFIVLLNALWLRTGKAVYRDLMHFWFRLFALGFVMGVVTGVVLSYEIGANWSGFSRVTGNVTGPLLMYEALTAFFLEGGFIGIVLFGEARVGRRMHLFSCSMVALGTLLSAFWVLAANSWMQTPRGATLGGDRVFHVDDWAKVIFNPSLPYRFAHMVCAS